MKLQSLQLTNFKNIAHCALQLAPKVNCFLGNNGAGKSNLLDAIHYLSFVRSFSGIPDSMLIKRGEDFAIAKGQYLRRDAEEELSVGLSLSRRRSLKRSGKEYRRLSEHIGLFPLVMVSPSDSELVGGSGEVRRRFMDMLISQADKRYLEALIRYQQALTQRNAMLRDAVADANLFLAVETAMGMSAAYIHSARAEMTKKLSVLFGKYYEAISGTSECPSLHYRSHLSDNSDLTTLLDAARNRDQLLKHTSVGPHRDDIEMMLDDMPARLTASQGQTKTYTIALRFAQYDFLKQITAMSPLLLLDDIFDKLDAGRVERIMRLVASETFGQIFVTDTNRGHLDEIITHINGSHGVWSVCNGAFTQTLLGNNQ